MKWLAALITTFWRTNMKFRIIIFASLLGLAGCASTSRTDSKLTVAEKQEINDGKLVKPELLTTIDQKAINVRKSDTVFICVTHNTRNDTCYLHLGAVASEYFEKDGIHTTQNRNEATNTIKLLIGFGYIPTDISNKTVMETAEASFGEDKTFDHIKLTTDEENADLKNAPINAGVGAAAGALLMGLTGHNVSNAALTSTSNTQNIRKDETRQAIIVTLYQESLYAALHRVTVQYHGPADPARTFPVLFDEAMKEAASKVVIN
jgi:outer membrane lipoprotein SlyB